MLAKGSFCRFFCDERLGMVRRAISRHTWRGWVLGARGRVESVRFARYAGNGREQGFLSARLRSLHWLIFGYNYRLSPSLTFFSSCIWRYFDSIRPLSISSYNYIVPLLHFYTRYVVFFYIFRVLSFMFAGNKNLYRLKLLIYRIGRFTEKRTMRRSVRSKTRDCERGRERESRLKHANGENVTDTCERKLNGSVWEGEKGNLIEWKRKKERERERENAEERL